MSLSAPRNVFTPLILTCLFISIKVAADSPGRPQPYAFESGDYIFVRFEGFSPENKGKYLESHANFYNEHCKSRDNIADSRKARCRTLDAIKRYPHSGVYRKDDPSKLVWWGGSCGRAYYMTSDAEYVVTMGPWASDIKQLAVSFCKRQRLIAHYSINDLVDDESRLPRTVSHFRWRSNTSFDDKTATLFIKTLDNNEYTFDVRTGKIVKYEYTPFKVYQASVHYKNGERITVGDLTSCSGMTYATLFMGRGFPIHQLQIIAESVKNEKGGERVQTGAIPFEHIKKARFVSNAEKLSIWEITTPQNQTGQVMLDPSNSDLCGKDNKGEQVEISLMDIDSLELSEVTPSASRAAIRTVEQRMRWDMKHWDKDRRMLCENTSFKDFNTAWEFKNLIGQFKSAKCTNQSKYVVVAMDRVNQWLQQQQHSEETLTLAKEAAEFQSRARLSGQALIPYEYLLKSYQKDYDERNRRQLIKINNLLREMISVSWSAGLLSEYEKYRKRSRGIYAILKKQNTDVKEQQDKKKREKIKAYHRSIENIKVASVKSDHRFPGDKKHLLDWECKDQKKAAISAANAYKSIFALEKKLHPEGHAHILEAGISLSNCHKLKKNYEEAKASFEKVLALYLQMDKQGQLSAAGSLAINRNFMRLMIHLTPNRNDLIDETIALNLRRLLRNKETNDHKAMFETLGALAWNYSLLGDKKMAEKYYKERIELSVKLDEGSRIRAKSGLEKYYEQREFRKQIGSRTANKNKGKR